jgi:hypothetical protein
MWYELPNSCSLFSILPGWRFYEDTGQFQQEQVHKEGMAT